MMHDNMQQDMSIPEHVTTMSEEDFFVALKQSVADQQVLDLTDQVVSIATTIKLARGESLFIKNGTLIGDCHSIFSMGTDRGYDNGPPALTLEGITL
jgi:hypothetical protein